MGYVVDTVALRQVFPRKILYFPVTTTTNSPHPFVYSTTFTEKLLVQFQSSPYRICGAIVALRNFLPEKFFISLSQMPSIRLFDNIHRKAFGSIPEQSI